MKCSYCEKGIDSYRDNEGHVTVDTHYCKGAREDKIYYCDAYCATAAHEKNKELANLLK